MMMMMMIMMMMMMRVFDPGCFAQTRVFGLRKCKTRELGSGFGFVAVKNVKLRFDF